MPLRPKSRGVTVKLRLNTNFDSFRFISHARNMSVNLVVVLIRGFSKVLLAIKTGELNCR